LGLAPRVLGSIDILVLHEKTQTIEPASKVSNPSLIKNRQQ
jgi:hypothetical protein